MMGAGNSYGGPYTERYAARYEQFWHQGPWGAQARWHLDAFRRLIRHDTRWLDAGCGTGYYLRHFPGIARAGFDKSPAMLARARAASPDALFFKEWDLRNDEPAWRDDWSLVTCNGYPWSYVESMGEIEQVAENLANWTAPEGTCFMQVGDITDLVGVPIPMNYRGDPLPTDRVVITGIIWSFVEPGGFRHNNMYFPSVDIWVQLFAKRFRRVEIVRWPMEPPGVFIHPRVLVASEKRSPGDNAPATIVDHPPPDTQPENPPVGFRRADERSSPSRLSDQPLSYLVARFTPWRLRFWQAVVRHGRRVVGQRGSSGASRPERN